MAWAMIGGAVKGRTGQIKASNPASSHELARGNRRRGHPQQHGRLLCASEAGLHIFKIGCRIREGNVDNQQFLSFKASHEVALKEREQKSNEVLSGA